MIYQDTNYLQHHGIKGQKWGIRRFQNKDGTLNAAGKKRYGYGHAASQLSKYGNRARNAHVNKIAGMVGLGFDAALGVAGLLAGPTGGISMAAVGAFAVVDAGAAAINAIVENRSNKKFLAIQNTLIKEKKSA